MKAAGPSRVVLVTCGTRAEAQKIARATVSKRLAACANIVLGPVESWFWWKGKVETSREWLMVLKTTTKRLVELEREVKRLHSYEVPEFLVLPVVAGSKDYLAWLSAAVKRKSQ